MHPLLRQAQEPPAVKAYIVIPLPLLGYLDHVVDEYFVLGGVDLDHEFRILLPVPGRHRVLVDAWVLYRPLLAVVLHGILEGRKSLIALLAASVGGQVPFIVYVEVAISDNFPIFDVVVRGQLIEVPQVHEAMLLLSSPACPFHYTISTG
jgi:hypothetical protein